MARVQISLENRSDRFRVRGSNFNTVPYTTRLTAALITQPEAPNRRIASRKLTGGSRIACPVILTIPLIPITPYKKTVIAIVPSGVVPVIVPVRELECARIYNVLLPNLL